MGGVSAGCVHCFIKNTFNLSFCLTSLQGVWYDVNIQWALDLKPILSVYCTEAQIQGGDTIPAFFISISLIMPPRKKPKQNEETELTFETVREGFEYTPAFKKILDKLQKDPNRKQRFPEEMSKLGWRERIVNLYRIKDKRTGKFIQFKPNKAQLNFLDSKSGKDLILKSRQIGFTTLAGIYGLDRALWDGLSCGIMAHDQKLVSKIFEDQVKKPFNHFVTDWEDFVEITPEKNNTALMNWHGLDGSMRVAYSFQGYTVHVLHVSEAAFIDPNRLKFSFESVPEEGEIIMESTPNGQGGIFYGAWKNFKKLNDKALFKGHFYPWYENYPENPAVWIVDDEDAFLESLDDSEAYLVKTYELEAPHILWRRSKIQAYNDENGTSSFDAQYPVDDETCFLSGINQVYNRDILIFQMDFVQDPIYVGELKLEEDKIKFNKVKAGHLNVWQLPKPTSSYVIGADPSSGTGKDPGCAVVLHAATGEEVAELWGFFDPDLFAEQLFLLGKFYNNAYVCVEANNHGMAVLTELKKKYYNLYKHKTYDLVRNRKTKKLGFLTTNTSKTFVTDQHIIACREGAFRVRSNALLGEMSTFRESMSDNGKLKIREAAPGTHDDRVMAACLAYEALKSKPSVNTLVNSSFLSDDNRPYDPYTGFLVN